MGHVNRIDAHVAQIELGVEAQHAGCSAGECGDDATRRGQGIDSGEGRQRLQVQQGEDGIEPVSEIRGIVEALTQFEIAMDDVGADGSLLHRDDAVGIAHIRTCRAQCDPVERRRVHIQRGIDLTIHHTGEERRVDGRGERVETVDCAGVETDGVHPQVDARRRRAPVCGGGECDRRATCMHGSRRREAVGRKGESRRYSRIRCGAHIQQHLQRVVAAGEGDAQIQIFLQGNLAGQGGDVAPRQGGKKEVGVKGFIRDVGGSVSVDQRATRGHHQLLECDDGSFRTSGKTHRG